MKTIVCVKQVPSTNEVRLDPITKTIIRDGKLSVINPFDTFAVELALEMKDQLGGEVIALSMGIPETERLLRDTMSRGVDQSVLLSDREFAGADTLATAYTLSRGIAEINNYDLILCGKMAIDGDTGQIGPELAEYLGVPHITDVKEIISINQTHVVCKKVTDRGHQIVEAKLPLLLAVIKDINVPRLPSISGVKRSLKATFVMKNAKDLEVDYSMIGLNGSPTQVYKTYVPENENTAIEVQGDTSEKARKLVKLIEEVI